MSAAPRERALALVEADLELLLADPDAQEAWARARGVSAVEIALQFYDAIPGYLEGMRARGVIDLTDEQALLRLDAYLQEVQGVLFLPGPRVARVKEWDGVRDLAASALSGVRRPVSEKKIGEPDT
jgi:hypothetical protein